MVAAATVSDSSGPGVGPAVWCSADNAAPTTPGSAAGEHRGYVAEKGSMSDALRVLAAPPCMSCTTRPSCETTLAGRYIPRRDDCSDCSQYRTKSLGW